MKLEMMGKMGKALEIEITAREIIKPTSPTPHHLRNFKLSLMDQILPIEYAEGIHFYTINGEKFYDLHAKVAEISQRLKASLAQTLTRYYPWAGVIRDHILVECNDSGVEYVEAKANCLLSEFLQWPDQKLLRRLAPIEIESPKAAYGPLLLVQVTFFTCGGMAIVHCLSHKMGDAWAACKFINSWAKTARGSIEALLPQFDQASRFPPDDSSVPYMAVMGPNHVTRRFLFDPSKIAELRTKIASPKVPKPSRVEAVVALLWKCTINASRSARGYPRLSITAHYMDLRKMVSPPLSENSMGNFVGNFSAETSEGEINLQDLVCELRRGKEEFSKNGLKSILENRCIHPRPELEVQIGRDEIDFYVYSDVTRFPFYEADFGWGKPVWVTMPNYTQNVIMLLKGPKDSDEIEVLINLREEDMAFFERDPELLEFAAFNPSILL